VISFTADGNSHYSNNCSWGKPKALLKTDKKGKEIILSTTRVQNSAETFKKDTGTHLTINIIYPMSNIGVFMQRPLQVVVPKQTIQGIYRLLFHLGAIFSASGLYLLCILQNTQHRQENHLDHQG